MALLAALGHYSLQVHGFRHRDLRRLVEPLLARPYTPNQMTYDLRRLRRRGLIARVEGTHRYFVTPLGLRLAYLFTKLYRRLLKPGWAILLQAPPVSPPIRKAMSTLLNRRLGFDFLSGDRGCCGRCSAAWGSWVPCSCLAANPAGRSART